MSTRSAGCVPDQRREPPTGSLRMRLHRLAFANDHALDDFGAGFCNFHYLKVLPIDFLKLDRSMLAGVLANSRDRAVFRAIMGMAKALDLRVLVEGVETEEQRAFIAAEDCAYYQGFLRAGALPDVTFREMATA